MKEYEGKRKNYVAYYQSKKDIQMDKVVQVDESYFINLLTNYITQLPTQNIIHLIIFIYINLLGQSARYL